MKSLFEEMTCVLGWVGCGAAAATAFELTYNLTACLIGDPVLKATRSSISQIYGDLGGVDTGLF